MTGTQYRRQTNYIGAVEQIREGAIGDIVSIEHTPRTRTNVFFDRIFRISLGLYLNPDSIWNND